VDVVPGQLVKSLVGRDQGKHYLVIRVEADRVMLANGRNRTVGSPKRKNPKHLQSYRCTLPEVNEKIKQGRLNDTEVREILNTLLKSDEFNWLNHSLRNSSNSGS